MESNFCIANMYQKSIECRVRATFRFKALPLCPYKPRLLSLKTAILGKKSNLRNGRWKDVERKKRQRQDWQRLMPATHRWQWSPLWSSYNWCMYYIVRFKHFCVKLLTYWWIIIVFHDRGRDKSREGEKGMVLNASKKCYIHSSSMCD